MIYKKKDTPGKRWTTIKVCHDQDSDLYAIECKCFVCEITIIDEEPVHLNEIGALIQSKFPMYLCDKCERVVQTYHDLKKSTETPKPIEIEIETPTRTPLISVWEREKSKPYIPLEPIPCRNHDFFMENCGQCLSANAKRSRT